MKEQSEVVFLRLIKIASRLASHNSQGWIPLHSWITSSSNLCIESPKMIVQVSLWFLEAYRTYLSFDTVECFSYESRSLHVMLFTALLPQRHGDNILWLIVLSLVTHHPGTMGELLGKDFQKDWITSSVAGQQSSPDLSPVEHVVMVWHQVRALEMPQIWINIAECLAKDITAWY